MEQAIKQAVEQLFNVDVEPIVEFPEKQFGDLTSNVAMQIVKQVGKNPREIAEQICEKLQSMESVESCSVAGPGFINIRLTNDELISLMSKRNINLNRGQKILVEYSDPNPFKPLHAGHLYTTLVGDSIARIIEKSGAETIRLNYGGDVGLHVAKSMWAIVKEFGEDIEAIKKIEPEQFATWLGDKYVEGNNSYEDDESSKQEIVEMNKKIYQIHIDNDHESPIAQIYWALRKFSYEFFIQLYERLEVKEFDRYIPESEVTQLGVDTVKAQTETGVYEHSDGAVIFDGDKFGLHKRVFINSEGLPTYETKDVGLSLTKWKDYNFDKSIIITANEQAQYMQVVIKSIEQFEPEPAQRTDHLTHGVLKLGGGVKMSSRKGNILSAFDVLDAAAQAGQESGHANNYQIVLASVKYALVKNRVGGDIVYDPKESIAMEGNSGPYLQYAHARACSILNKSSDADFNIKIDDLLENERSLVRKLSHYNSVLVQTTQQLAPHIVCNYLYELAQEFNRFYENNKVIGDERQNIRLNLVDEYRQTLADGLALLGINAPESM